MTAPLPPVELAARVGGWAIQEGGYDLYLKLGELNRALVESYLPEDWTWDDRRILDFGCGAGRTLRHFLPLSDRAELWGCDIDEPSIRWLQENMAPAINAFANGEAPPLDRPDQFFDLVYAISVFTHISHEWSAWLLELHRVLKDDGLVVASFLGPCLSEAIANEPWDESRIGMNVLAYGRSWRDGGPNVLLSPWWIRAHWGRAFEILALDPGSTPGEHGIVVMRKRPGRLSREDLERVEPDDPREELARRHQIRQLLDETASLRAQIYAAETAAAPTDQAERLAAVRAERDELARRLAVVEHSRSWRLTKPLRAGRRRLGS